MDTNSIISTVLQTPEFYNFLSIILILIFISILVFTGKGQRFFKLIFNRLKKILIKKDEVHIELDPKDNISNKSTKKTNLSGLKMDKSRIGDIQGNITLKDVDMSNSVIGDIKN